MCNNLTINQNVRLQCVLVHVYVRFHFFLLFFLSCQVCVFSETYVQCEFHFSVLSVFFGVKSIEPNCPNKKKQQQANQALPCKYVCRFYLLSICLCFCCFFCQSPTVSCVSFLCISTPHHLVYHIVSCCRSPIFIRLWSYTHAHFCCCAAHFHWHTCGKTTHTYITLHDDPGIHPHYTYMRLVWFFMLFIFFQTYYINAIKIQWIAKMYAHTGFAISIWGFIFTFARFLLLLFLSSACFVKMSTPNRTIYLVDTKTYMMYCVLFCTLFKYILPILV